MAVDPYSPCPCGSGQKFKWCCHKVEAFADRAQRLYEGGQLDRALEALDEGLRKEPGNAWLLTRKAIILTRQNRPKEVKTTLQAVLAKHPKHLGALMLMARLELETEGAAAGVAQLQQAMAAFPTNERGPLAGLMKVVGAYLSESGDFPAARKHLFQSMFIAGEVDPPVIGALRTISNNAAISLWLKNDDVLSTAPDAAPEAAKARFLEALTWAVEGLWSSAAAGFELLTADKDVGAAAERNLGFCRLWLADDAAAVAALRRYATRLGTTPEAVDVEALCQQIDTETSDEEIEHVQLIWPLRDRSALLEALQADPTLHTEGVNPLDPNDKHSPEAETFSLLDRPDPRHGVTAPLADGGVHLVASEIPRIVGRVYIGQEIAALEAHDDGRLDRLSERFTSLAGPSLAPAHPRTKVLGKLSRLYLALAWEWLLPEGLDPEHARQLYREQGASLIREVWPKTPISFLRGRTPLQAGADGDAETPLRAAVLQLEYAREPWTEGFDFAALRARLRIPSEPELDPDTVNLGTVHVARLRDVPVERLSDEKLVKLFKQARAAGISSVIERTAQELVARPGAIEHSDVKPLMVYSELAVHAAARDDRDASAEWIRRGRQAEPAATRAQSAPKWDMFELRLRAAREDPSEWVPDLAVIVERYRDDNEATQVVVSTLVDLGLIEMTPHPERPGEMVLDPRPLQALLTEYGPRVTTSSGRLGVSAARPDIWTPGASGGTSGGIWTPGAGAPEGEKKNIIISGR
jgi:tetratricopeptide (TPR) repeat protein